MATLPARVPCTACRTPILADAAFCPHCGSRQTRPEPVSSPEPTSGPVPVSGPGPASGPVPPPTPPPAPEPGPPVVAAPAGLPGDGGAAPPPEAPGPPPLPAPEPQTPPAPVPPPPERAPVSFGDRSTAPPPSTPVRDAPPRYGPPARADGFGEPDRGPAASGSLLGRARRGDDEALATLFSQFVDEDEQIVEAAYLGMMGLVFGDHSFGCVTDRRVATIRTGSFGEMFYQDGYVEDLNSTMVYQPAIWKLYVAFGIVGFFALGALASALDGGLAGLLVGLPVLLLTGVVLVLLPRIYYKFVKSGLVVVVAEGASVYMFTDRQRLKRANRLLRAIAAQREARRRARR